MTAEGELERLAESVAVHLPGWQVSSATLAMPGALERASAGAPGRVFPLFMAGGWFTRVHIPERIKAAGAEGWTVLEPFGCNPAVHDLAVTVAREAGAGEVLLAAHGSFKSPVPAAIANVVARRIAAETGARSRAAFIDQEPRLADMAGFGEDAVCLPFFAMAGGHVTEDIPAALASAGFAGRILPPLGLDPRVPALIAEAISSPLPICAAECRWAAA